MRKKRNREVEEDLLEVVNMDDIDDADDMDDVDDADDMDDMDDREEFEDMEESEIFYFGLDEEQSNKGKKKHKRDIFSAIFLIVFIGIFLFSASQLYSIYSGYKDGADTYQEVSELAISVPEAEVNEDGEVEEVPYEYYYVDFDALSAQNSDVVAWIRFDAPEVINYPVVQTSNNSTYLTTTFLGEYNSVGTLFVDMNNSSDFSDQNTIIYGHNMKDDSMFGALNEYVSEAFYQEYPYFYIYTPDGKAYKYEVVAAEVVSAYDTYRYTQNFDSATAFQEYIDSISRTAYYDTDVVLDYGSKLVTLSTCTSSDDERFIVQGERVEIKDMVNSEEVQEELEEEE